MGPNQHVGGFAGNLGFSPGTSARLELHQIGTFPTATRTIVIPAIFANRAPDVVDKILGCADLRPTFF